MRTYGLPGMDLWDKLLDRAIVLQFHEDNETTIGAMKHGASPTMRHLKRTHGVCLRWLAERFKHDCTNQVLNPACTSFTLGSRTVPW